MTHETVPEARSLSAASPSISPQDNVGFRSVFAKGKLTLGVMLPIESYAGDMPTMASQEILARYAERHGFVSLAFRDVPLRDPAFGDVGQIYDPWVYLGYIAAQTQRIALLTASIVLPLRHPIHTAKAAASIDRLTAGRLLLGIASGDRPVEFPAFGADRDGRGEAFREQVALLKAFWAQEYPELHSRFGRLSGADVIPKPIAARVPLLVTGYSQSTLEWIAQNADGWMTYPREVGVQALLAAQWRRAVEAIAPGQFKPFIQSYYIDLVDDPHYPREPIHLGHRLGRHALVAQLERLRDIGVNHVVLNMKYGRRPAREALEELGEFVTRRFQLSEQAA